MAGYYGFTLDIRVSVRPSVSFSFPDGMNFYQTRYVHRYCGDLVFWIVNGQISSNSYEVIFPRRNNGGVLTFLYFVLYSIAQTCFRICTK